jgi:hypothetical protein
MGGLRRLHVFTGAHSFTAINNGLMFRIPGKGFAKDSINLVTVTLTPMDEYIMTFSRVRGGTVKEIRRYEGVYCDMLMDLFEEATGLYLSFNSRTSVVVPND